MSWRASRRRVGPISPGLGPSSPVLRGAALALAGTLAAATPAQEVIIVGGGPRPVESEAQIEFNVLWVSSVVREVSPEANLTVFFADGTEGGAGVYEAGAVAGDPLAAHPLVRIFGGTTGTPVSFRPHEVPEVAGSTRAPDLVPELERAFDALRPGDRAMVIYNGHGTWEEDHAENALRLWDETFLSVREFEGLISRIDPEVPIRFIFTQCYSGAFERAVHPGAADVMELAVGQRCGFLAESEDRESEGCSASINVGDYRDYTTYFFSALTGRTRLGVPIEADPDVDGDGTVTPFEAHLYALSEGYNGDLPRSTSEVFLERWQPWYLRWIDTGGLPDNEYGQVARRLAEANDLPLEPPALSAALEERMSLTRAEVLDLKNERSSLEGDISASQDDIRAALQAGWPDLVRPEQTDDSAFVASAAPEAIAAAEAHPAYAALVQAQDALRSLEAAEIDADRRLAQLEKLRRSRKLARILDQLRRHGSERDRAAYAQLRECEALPI